MEYQEKQFGWFLNLFLLILILSVGTIYLLQIGDNPLPSLFTQIIELVFIFIILLFYNLTVKIDNNQIKIIFGIGLIKKKILLQEIATVKSVRNKWYYGWGIRAIRIGWIYNIQGLDAVELTFKNKESIIRIGTKSNSNLENEIKKRIT